MTPDPAAPGLCEHLQPGTWPLRTDLVLDEHLGITDALVSCHRCATAYLLEMLDWQGSERVMRLALLEPEHAARLIRDLTRGSCDPGRAAAEVEHARSRATFLPWLLRVDSKGPGILGFAPVPRDTRLPAAPWRERLCDGAWVEYARQHSRPSPD